MENIYNKQLTAKTFMSGEIAEKDATEAARRWNSYLDLVELARYAKLTLEKIGAARLTPEQPHTACYKKLSNLLNSIGKI